MRAHSFQIFAAVCASLCASVVHAELIPSTQLGNWTPGVVVGVPGGIDQYVTGRTRLIDVTKTPYNADTTGNTDASTAIQAAIQAAQSGDVIYLPAGTYRVEKEISLKNNTTLRGAGVGVTTILAYGTSDVLKCSLYSAPFWDQTSNPTVSSATTKGTTVLTIPDTSSFTVGWLAQVTHAATSDQYDPYIETSVWSNSGGHAWLRRQKVKVVAKTATTLTISPGLYGDLTHAVRVASSQYYGTGIGVEDLSLNMDNSSSTSGITFGGLMNSWIKNVKVWGAKNYNVCISDCFQTELRDSHIDLLNHTGSSGAGLLMMNSSATLVENNIITGANSCVEVDNGCSGNVFGYNFVLNTAGSFAFNTNHSPHNSFNLYEGNVATTLICDGYHGSASHDTLYRNWVTGIDTGGVGTKVIGWVVSLKRFTRNYSLVGNIFGASGYSMAYDGFTAGQPNMGNSFSSGIALPWADWGTYPGATGYQELDSGVASTLNRKGNYNYYDKAIPAAEQVDPSLLVSSLYLAAKPAWFGSLAWPAINPFNPTTVSYDSIPAGYRYTHGTAVPSDASGTIATQKPINVRVSGP